MKISPVQAQEVQPIASPLDNFDTNAEYSITSFMGYITGILVIGSILLIFKHLVTK